MTLKEISELRKSGRLAQALEAAEEEFAQNQNNYTASALFWCLYDMTKRPDCEDVEAIYQRLKSLNEDHDPQNEYMQRCVAALEKKLMAHYDELTKAVEEAKADTHGQRARELANRFCEYFDKGELSTQLHRNLGWLLYYGLKNTPTSDAYNRKRLLMRYLKLEIERPSALHSRILSEAVRLEHDTPLQFRIRDFVKLWGLENLREEDWEQYKTQEGNTLPSLVEKLIGVYTKELKTDNVAPEDDFVKVVDRALKEYPKNQNMPYFKAMVLLQQGRNEEAVKYYKDLLLKSPSKFYLWDQLANIVEDPEIKIALLCKGVNTGEDDGFIGGTRLRLAQALIAKGLYGNAKTELNKYYQTYTSRNWTVKEQHGQIASLLPPQTQAEDNAHFYLQYFPIAEEFIYSELSSVYAVKVADKLVEDNKHPGKKITMWILKADTKTLQLKKPKKYGLDNRTVNGTVFEVKVKDGKIVWIKKASSIPTTLSWLKEETGTVTLKTDKKGNPYIILNKVYVGANLLKGIKDGQTLTVLAIRQEDGRWNAVSLKKK